LCNRTVQDIQEVDNQNKNVDIVTF
jgi:hypothetical protein